ncbi:multicopper oxidase family protein [Amycolatopsis taiwanensis]|uniref:Multicopper oxidase CueO n=1 Tax=Amycolatopsis taiwanensis TaxID=342230 RepID=A0A9W6VJU5_9PSEU|nr:multicopper oxidase domain-containing protein [Amycolatopsis taiwanensis]GLY69909.1 spore coat protein A [Amycolatopsis taiwanensis]
MTLSRRGFLGLLGGVGAAATLGAGVPWLASPVEIGRLLRSRVPLPAPFAVPLPIPPVLRPRTDAATDYYEITQRAAVREILPGVRTEIWGYDGQFPGPTIVSRSGRRTVVQHENRLPVPTVVHLHGGHTPAESDGYPTDLILPVGQDHAMSHSMPGMGMGMTDHRAVVTKGTRTYEYPMHQRAATLWYHDHRMDFTGASVWRGLAGFHLVQDDEEAALPLPHSERDIPLMLTDRAFDADGSLAYPSLDPTLQDKPGVEAAYGEGVLGDVILVNGAPWPQAEVDAARYRFRMLNASNARRYRLALDPPPPGGAGLVQIGSDGGLLAQPIAHDEVEIAPAERFDVVIDFSRYRVGDRVRLVNRLGSDTTADVMQFVIARTARDDSHLPDQLSRIEMLDPAKATVTRDIVFRTSGGGMWTVNGQPFDPNRADTIARLGATEIWRFTTDFHHPVHIHHSPFQVLTRNGRSPGRFDSGWKDTVIVEPAGQLSVIIRFDEYAGRFLYHCHNLEHEDMAMMANLEIRP